MIFNSLLGWLASTSTFAFVVEATTAAAAAGQR